MMSSLAHKLNTKHRTNDVITGDNTTFYHMGLSQDILEGLTNCGFEKPSPIQLTAIPLGRCGVDLIIQAKSGTGKTAVFGIAALDMVYVKNLCPQVLILAPTREIAIQISQVITSIGSEIKGLKVGCIVGGIPTKLRTKKTDNYHIIVGTPGKLKHLIGKKMINVENIRLFVLDEADKLMDDSFRDDIDEIFINLPENKQVISTSATYPSNLQWYLSKYMRSPHYSSPYSDNPILVGVRQFVATVQSHPNKMKQIQLKTEELIKIFEKIPFKQCLVFLNYQARVQSICNHVNKMGYPSTYIIGNQNMTKRLDAIAKLKNFECKVLFSTDLTARGIDAENVNLIINYDIPNDCSTYLHRIGRAGRYGSYGIAINLVAENELNIFKDMINPIASSNLLLFKCPEYSESIWTINVDELELFFITKESKNNFENTIINENGNFYQNNSLQTNDINDELNTIDSGNSVEEITHDHDAVESSNFLEKNLDNIEIADSKECHSKPSQQVLKSEAVNYLPIHKFIDKLYCNKIEILEKNGKVQSTPTCEMQSCLTETLFTKSSQFQAWNEGVTFPTCPPNFMENDQVIDDVKVATFLNYQICNKNSDITQDESEQKSVEFSNFDRYSSLKTLCESNHLELISCCERLQENLTSESNTCVNFDKDDSKICYKKLLSWSKNLGYEIEDVNKLLRITSLYIRDTGRKWIYRKYWYFLKVYFEFQKKILDFVYTKFHDGSKTEDEYFLSSHHQNESCLIEYDEVDNFENDIFVTIFKLLFPYPIKLDKLLCKLMSDQDLKNYSDSKLNIRSYLHSQVKLLKLKECMFYFTKNERIKLERQVEMKKRQEGEITFNELEEFLRQQKENKTKNKIQNTSDFGNVNHFQEWREVIDENSSVSDITHFTTYNKSISQSMNTFPANNDFLTQKYQYPPNKQYEHNYIPSLTSGTQNTMFEANGEKESQYIQDEPQYYNYPSYSQEEYRPQNNNRNTTESLDEFFRRLDIQTEQLHLQEYFRLMMQN